MCFRQQPPLIFSTPECGTVSRLQILPALDIAANYAHQTVLLRLFHSEPWGSKQAEVGPICILVRPQGKSPFKYLEPHGKARSKVLRAVQNSGMALRYASPGLQGNKGLARPPVDLEGASLSGSKDYMNTRILHIGLRPKTRGIPETVVCRILMFMWSFGHPAVLGTLWILWLLLSGQALVELEWSGVDDPARMFQNYPGVLE